ncbi:HTH-type transcriptional regulator betI [Actinoplanes sp. SE50]|uniref:TetR/AcrR family transcriptional regulator n=1 Tax=unclassified Actinoplanes TaxID=2626549 RepID=UPI00023ED124|nr:MULTISPECIES: TetR/AcrR family transcriptional regulator [unclassified Actinoplanes]AEV87263.1 HTH-type transcriptional regulator betI [Actinoplanes sp. SE50/110]ATO85663.1 HTH-type transcriptional regulator betI [Actinoplanes sp. SE50]SLM03076.1 TetR family transcriptional regulator [Actinoplanes sp. SE50/110]
MRRSAAKRVEVLAAAGEVVAARGADATRFADVSAATGVGVSTLQYYFGTREDMLIAVFRHAAERDFELVGERLAGLTDPWDRLLAIARHLGSDLSWRLWVESWRWASRDAEVRADVLADYTRWRELIAATIEADNPMRVARQVLALIDGLALPVVLGDPAVDRAAANELLEEALARLLGRAPAL